MLWRIYCFPTLVQEAALAGVPQVVDKGLSGMELVSAVETVLGDKPRRVPVSA